MYYAGESNVPGAPGNLMAGTPSFPVNQTPGALGKRSGEQLQRLYKGGTQSNEQLNEELMRRNIMPGAGPQLPLAYGFPGIGMNNGGSQLGNIGFFLEAQRGQQASNQRPPGPPVGYVKTVS